MFAGAYLFAEGLQRVCLLRSHMSSTWTPLGDLNRQQHVNTQAE